MFLSPSTRSDWEKGTTARMPTSSQVLRNRAAGVEESGSRHWMSTTGRPEDRVQTGRRRGPGSASVLPPVPFKVAIVPRSGPHPRPCLGLLTDETKRRVWLCPYKRDEGRALASAPTRHASVRTRPPTPTPGLDPDPTFGPHTNTGSPWAAAEGARPPAHLPVLVVLVEVLV